ncbi:MAG: biopolymer transporter ExbD [Duodenibacillus sp.]|nr:biopolymer transporter ExbD [Duodenibacillus sp.]HBC69479.1 protein TolR [Sutterella sp.]
MALRSLSSVKRRRMMSDMNVVPYIDVMLVLVVILMVAAPFVNPSVVNLPKVSKASTAPQNPVEVIVYADNRLAIKVKGKIQSVDMPALIASVKGAQSGEVATPVIISADKDARYEQVVNVMRRLQQAEVQRVGLALQIERGK